MSPRAHSKRFLRTCGLLDTIDHRAFRREKTDAIALKPTVRYGQQDDEHETCVIVTHRAFTWAENRIFLPPDVRSMNFDKLWMVSKAQQRGPGMCRISHLP